MIQSLSKNLVVIISSLVIASCGGGGGGSGGTTTPVIPAPTINLSAAPTSVLLENTSTLNWSSNNTTSCSASWTTQTGTSGSEAVTINSVGSNSFSISCTGDGGTRSASVTVEGYRNTDGVVVDGYISGAEVCIDENDNWTCDSSENSTTSDNEGKFTIRYANGNLVSIGGTDLDSQTLLDNLLITHKLTGHSDFKAVTPVTSVAAFMEDASLVNSALGIDSSIDVFTFDPVANKGDGGINDYLYEKGNQLTVLAFALQNITNNLNTTTETTQDYFKAITEEIEKEYTETETKVDIETEAFVIKALDNVIAAKLVTIDETAKDNFSKVLSGMLPIIQIKSSDDLTTSIIRFAVSTLQTDIQAIANGTATAEIVTSYTENLLNYIAEDQSIDSDEIAPDINTIPDSTPTAEDTAVTINVLRNDSYVTSAPFSLSATNGANGSTSIFNNLITYSPDADYYGSDSFSYTLTQGEKNSSAAVTVTVEAVNDEPSINIASTIQVQENQTAVTTISLSDVDEDDLSLTLGGTDADSFNLSSDNVLTFKEPPDYETKTSYSITLTVSDGTVTVPKDVTIVIIDINDAAPIFTSDPTFNVAENQTAIGTVTASDPEGDSFSFSISGTELKITAAGILTFASPPDYETKATYTATVTVEDTEDNSETQDITINVTDVNDNDPVFTSSAAFNGYDDTKLIYISSRSHSEAVKTTDLDINKVLSKAGDTIVIEASLGEPIICPSATDFFKNSDDTDSTLNKCSVIVKLLAGSQSGDTVTIESSTDLILAVDRNDDYDASHYDLINCSGGCTEDAIDYLRWDADDWNIPKRMTISINKDIEELSNTSLLTQIISSSELYKGFDPEDIFPGQSFDDSLRMSFKYVSPVSYSISNSDISIDPNNGELKFVNSVDIDNQSSYTATVTANDGVNSSTQDITISIKPNASAPVFTSSATFSAAENQTAIDTVTATDDDGDTITFTITGSDLEITPAGVLTFASAPDYETQSSYTATVTANDGTNATTQTITVNVTNVNDIAPVFTSSATFSAAENQTAIDTVTATDSEGDSVTFIVSGSDLEITPAGVLTFASAPDYETQSSYTATVTASDGTNPTTQVITVNVTNVNDIAPVFTSSATFSAAENQKAIDTVTATDSEGDSVTFIVSGSDLEITPAGVLTFASAPDYETQSSYTATVTASDGTNPTTQVITVNVTNVNDNSPVIKSSANFNANENQRAIGTVIATDVDMDGIIYSIVSSDITIDSSSGDIEFNSSPDYETKTSYSATVSVTDGSFSVSQEIVVNINDIPEETIQVSVAANNNGSGNVYVINGTQRPALDLVKGVTYTFVHPSNHPLRFSQTANGIHGGGSQFYSDINTDTNGITIIKVSDITPESFYYYCSIHPGMGNAITRTDSVLNNPPVASSASYYLNLLPQDQSSTNITLDATDEDGDSLTYSVVSDVSYGTTSISGSTLTYLTNPSTQSAQTESFSFKANDGTVDSKAVTITIDLKTDPLYQHQWHLNNTGQTNFATNAGTVGQDLNVDSVIADGITGNGIKISIVDDGLEIAHEDLIDNVITGSWNFIDSGTDPTQSSSFTGGGHGTSIGGIVAAKGWNNKGGRGIAPNASIFGYNLLETGLSSQFDQSLGVNSPGGVTADIYNMSFGAAYGTDANGNLLPEYNLPWYLTESQEQKYINGTSNLRDDKGSVYLWAAGNEFNDSSVADFCGIGEPLSCTETSIDNINAMPYIIAVGALDANGLKTSYSTPGAGLWVSGFGGGYGYNSDIYSGVDWEDEELGPAVMTIDRSGCVNGYSSGVDGDNYSGRNTFDIGGYGFADNENLNSTCSYFSSFNGTSASTPTVAGVVALILEANPNLTWRDVKHILVTTSDKIDVNRTTSLAGVSQYDWITNAAGHEHHNWYGFGKINASAAVSAAKSYSANSLGQFINTGYLEVSPNSAIEDGQATTSTIEVTKPSGSNGIVEFVRVSLSFNHPAAWSVGVRLQSPSGTIINLMQPNTNIANPEDTLFDIGASAFYGESLEGTWTIQLIDYYADNSGTFNTFGIQIYGN